MPRVSCQVDTLGRPGSGGAAVALACAVRHSLAHGFKFGRRAAESQATQALRLHP